MRKPSKQQRRRWDTGNRAAATVILSNRAKHLPFMVQWAKRCLARLSEETTGQRSFDFGGRGGSNL